jgi:hypothetical protein
VDAGFNVVGMPPTADLKGWIAPENGEAEEKIHAPADQ